MPISARRRGPAPRAEGAEESNQLSLFRRAEVERVNLGLAGWRRWRRRIVLDYPLEASELAGMHIGRAARDTAQRGHLVGALKLWAGDDREIELVASLTLIVVEAAVTVERVGERELDALAASGIFRQAPAWRNAGIRRNDCWSAAGRCDTACIGLCR